MSSHASTQDKSPDPSQALNIERKKTKVLKQALKQERKDNATLQQEFEKAQSQIAELNNQLQDKEKRYFDLYQEKMMLEETLIRESANSKIQNRIQQQAPKPIVPVTFAGPTPKLPTPASQQKEGSSAANVEGGSANEESKASDQALEGLNENNFDVVQSPQPKRSGTITSKPEGKSSKQAMVPQEQYDALKARFIENETTTQRRLESINDLEKTIQRREEQIQNMEKMYLQKLETAKKELDEFKSNARDNEKQIQHEVKVAKEEKAQALTERDEQVQIAKDQVQKSKDSCNKMTEQTHELDDLNGKQRFEIERLEQELQRAKDDVSCRKMIIEEMSKSMLHHEKESMEMAQKLTLMKNQIMESDAASGMMRQYAAVRLGKIRHHPCTVEFVKGEDEDFFMVIDGRHETITINFNNIDQFAENDETGRLILVYHMPAEPTTFNPNAEGMVKKRDEFECAENDLITKTFCGIRNKMMGTAGDVQFVGHQFQQQAANNIPADYE